MQLTKKQKQEKRNRAYRAKRCKNMVKLIAKAKGLTVTGKDLSGVDELLDLFENGYIEIEVIEVKSV